MKAFTFLPGIFCNGMKDIESARQIDCRHSHFLWVFRSFIPIFAALNSAGEVDEWLKSTVC
jgi:hypothetical protein